MANVSKNQRRGQRVETFTHNCGGAIKMVGVFNKRIRWEARCESCGETHRRPSNFVLTKATAGVK